MNWSGGNVTMWNQQFRTVEAGIQNALFGVTARRGSVFRTKQIPSLKDYTRDGMRAPTMDLSSWLRSLGFEKYEATFRESAIDVGILPDLNEDHLREMGIPLGDRIRLMKAISLISSAETSSKRATASNDVRADTAERRQVTVMFCDLVGSTALSVSMDPEDLRGIISDYQKCVAETVDRYGGFVAKYMGDGVLIYFGYPQAHEHDAEQAVRAGLELVAAVNSLPASVPLQARVGIATGLVVVGDLVGSGDSQERGIVGETPNLAARLQSIAEPNMVVIADGTRKLIGNLFELANIGTDRPERTWRSGAALGGVAAKFGGRPFRGAACERPYRSGRPRRGTRTVVEALVASEKWRRPISLALWRGRDR